jgi:hypothetical protein
VQAVSASQIQPDLTSLVDCIAGRTERCVVHTNAPARNGAASKALMTYLHWQWLDIHDADCAKITLYTIAFLHTQFHSTQGEGTGGLEVSPIEVQGEPCMLESEGRETPELILIPGVSTDNGRHFVALSALASLG